MARWRLTEKHYLRVPGTEWERNETDTRTGKALRHRYEVGCYLDPDSPMDQNYPGEIIVCHEGTGQRNDIIFVGPPTMGMEPLDDEAEAISNSLREKWAHPVDSLPATGGDYNDALIKTFERQMNEIVEGIKKGAGVAVAVPSVSAEEFKTLQDQVAALMARNAELEAKPRRL